MKNKLSLVIILLLSTTIYAQKMKVAEGNFDFFKGQSEINVEFDYSNLTILKDELTNDEYVKAHSEDLEKKGKGKGKAWKKSWEASKELIYAPKFLELMNRDLYEDEGISFEEDLTEAKYTLILEVVWIYPGWNAAVMRQPAKLTTVIKFVETANRDNVLLKITSENAPGNRFGGTFSNEDRIGEGFAKTGKSLSKLIMKKAF
ncbi:hypothetical protein HSX10_05235 [Winogradskyella undariae]|uniref:hypothetical protein n=1 Tax=Winogradskyella TaxID=286104 RepID=UPI00156AA170|nr:MULTISPECIES: hypothetical protein [Winogradskyella]NRR90962.1 hypothetical protein [Winogradskyella undariae]QNK77359.1 hypothetical protein H7F37_14840 [Winogradskyella sp. PAMC22761]QXP80090.1 hypothetical protein H0I32_05500 [Winogradskyella sp. HaHa_3_26]